MQAAHGTTGVATVQTEAFTVDNGDTVLVQMTSGTGPVYVTVDGSTPTVAGTNTAAVVSGTGRTFKIPTGDAQTVKLISATDDGYAVEVWE